MAEDKSTSIGELETRLAEMENNWKRALADYRNFQKRSEEEKGFFIDFANESLIRQLLPVLDNLETLSNHIDDAGLQMIIKNFAQILAEEGLVEISAQDKEFDASTMEAIEMVEGKENTVIEVLNKGYLLKNKLLRPARVRVGSGDKKEER
ncbi:nucleotide exchange factor GrpE [candidate division WWE3 bacterium RIFOXYC1_FULL_39_7]|uniref:Protein GrpE n=2 Tax=Katanobacteria TaxID=422282 RepID=A0A1F4XA64_UNCKA|nr:MAG: nucleotide exchange factor GrpE [candidate division WWE3 bacterium RIFOXYC1_FULL_39_7]OGC77963.1 MAG: nucleotide exchange factor GrpE [candidate division WWE3 bacterium RIFOXYD1_FULL_39_9]